MLAGLKEWSLNRTDFFCPVLAITTISPMTQSADRRFFGKDWEVARSGCLPQLLRLPELRLEGGLPLRGTRGSNRTHYLKIKQTNTFDSQLNQTPN